MSKVIAVDVDITTVSSNLAWLHYLGEHYPLKKGACINYPRPYDLTTLFQVTPESNGFEFWRDAFLYDNLRPREDAVKYIPKIIEMGHKVVFVSQIFPEHSLSKTNFLNKWFPTHSGIIFTEQKEYVNYDLFIDDSIHQLNKQKDPSKVIQFRDDYIHKEKPLHNYKLVYAWDEIYTELERGEI